MSQLRVQEAFDDGILWVTLGEKAETLIGNIRDCIQALSGERPDFAGEREAAARLAELLDGRDVLLVVDDVWKRGHLETVFTRRQPVRPFDHDTNFRCAA